MKTAAVSLNTYPKTGFNTKSTSFKGDSRTFLVNVGTEDKVKDPIDVDNFHAGSFQQVVKGEGLYEKVKGTYEPDVIVKGTLYFADFEEPVGDWALGTHSIVIADYKLINSLSIPRVLDNSKDSPDLIHGQRVCLWNDIRYTKNKLAEMGIPYEPIDKADAKILEEEGENALHKSIAKAKEDAVTDEEKITSRYRELREMRRIVERSYVEINEHMKEVNFDYYEKHPKPIYRLPSTEP